jgi:acyl carrier protein
VLGTDEPRSLVYQEISELLAENKSEVGDVSGQDRLGDLGLSSLMLARLIIALDSNLGVDPFEEDIVISDMRSVDDIVGAYENALARRT